MPHFVIRAFVSALLALTLAACGKPSADELLAEGRAALERKDAPAAVIHFKGLVDVAPASAEGRLMLGKALLAAQDAAGAVIELDRAKELGAAEADLALPLARALAATGRAKDVVDRLAGVSLPEPRQQAELQVELASALLTMGQNERAESAVASALSADPANTDARLMQARLTASKGDVDAAFQQAEALLADNPKDAAALHLKGELLLLGRNDLKAAAPVFESALAADPRYVPAHLALMNISVRRNDLPGYEKQVKALQTALPRHPETLFAEIQLALVKNDIPAAKEKSERLLLLAPDNARALYFAGVTQLRAKSLVVAEGHLAKAVQQAPQAAEPRRVLAQLHLDNGNAPRALDVLSPLLAATPADSQALQIAGKAELQQGRLPQAEAYFQRAVAAKPDNTQARTALALAQIAKGDTQQGYAELERLAATDQDVQTDLTLIASLLSRGEFDKALKAVDALEAKAPALPMTHALRARVFAQQGKLPEARRSFEKALELDATYYPGVAGLVDLDAMEGKWDVAGSRLESHLKEVPRNYAALLRLTQVLVAGNTPPEAIQRRLEAAVQAHPADAEPRLLLVDYLLSRRALAAARAAAEQAVAAVPGSAELEDALGRVLLEVGDARQAAASFGKVVALRPTSGLAYLRLGTAQLRAGDLAAGRTSLERARQLSPESAEVLRAVMNLMLTERKYGEALALSREVQKRNPKDPLGFLLEADVHLNQRKLPEAIKSVRDAFALQPSSDLAVRLHGLQVLANRGADADRFAADWLRSNPADAAFISHLGSIALQRGDLPLAEARFRRAVEIRPADAVAMNNLAWALVQQGKSEALQQARKANELLPGQPALMDTLAAAMKLAGNLPEAVDWQRKAVAASNGEPRYRMRLAELLIASGNMAQAQDELKVLEALGENFPQRDKVLQLMKSAR
ncbi:MAG: PEP-CTERM system TPR-repeat protein PrsT [Betaproteobacteria bacterium]|nr:PEP-CTERM system TPR-repeat protein PrsT [Betaproteobacteria bacterium]